MATTHTVVMIAEVPDRTIRIKETLTNEAGLLVRFTTDFEVHGQTVSEISHFLRTMLFSRKYKDTGNEIQEINNYSADVMKVILCCVHGHFNAIGEVASANQAESAAVLKTAVQAQTHQTCMDRDFAAVAILQALKIPAWSAIDVLEASHALMVGEKLVKPWFLGFSALDNTEDVGSLLAVAYRLDLPRHFLRYSRPVLASIDDAVENDLDLPEYGFLELPGQVKMRFKEVRSAAIFAAQGVLARLVNNGKYSDEEDPFMISIVRQTLKSFDGTPGPSGPCKIFFDLGTPFEELLEARDMSNHSSARTWIWKFQQATLNFNEKFSGICLVCVKKSEALASEFDDVEKCCEAFESPCEMGHDFLTTYNSFIGNEKARAAIYKQGEAAKLLAEITAATEREDQNAEDENPRGVWVWTEIPDTPIDELDETDYSDDLSDASQTAGLGCVGLIGHILRLLHHSGDSSDASGVTELGWGRLTGLIDHLLYRSGPSSDSSGILGLGWGGLVGVIVQSLTLMAVVMIMLGTFLLPGSV